MLAKELIQCQQRAISQSQADDPFIFSPQMVRELQLLVFARCVLRWAARLKPALSRAGSGRPITYADESILVTIMVMAVWQVSPETLVKRMQRWSALALACGYTPGQVISASQLRRRRDNLGLWVYAITFCSLVVLLIQRGVLLGRDWVIDSTILDAFSRHDSAAGWSFSQRFGYKVHLLMCRDSLLPILLLVSPANANDAPWGRRLLRLAHFLFALPVEVVRADAAYFTRAILHFIVKTLQATPLTLRQF
jgi:hypothetical protein